MVWLSLDLIAKFCFKFVKLRKPYPAIIISDSAFIECFFPLQAQYTVPFMVQTF